MWGFEVRIAAVCCWMSALRGSAVSPRKALDPRTRPTAVLVSTSWVSAMAAKAAGASGWYRRARATGIECRAAVVHVDRHPTHTSPSARSELSHDRPGSVTFRICELPFVGSGGRPVDEAARGSGPPMRWGQVGVGVLPSCRRVDVRVLRLLRGGRRLL